VSTTTSRTQPALIGGLVMGVLSALPLVNLGNICCCLWVVSGGLVASYLLQQNQTGAITAGDGALVGLLAGVFGAVICMAFSIPIAIMAAPLTRALLQRLMENFPNMPADVPSATASGPTVLGTAFGLVIMLCVGAIFSTLGGLLGVAIFRKQTPPGPIDVPASS
jgi:hypothetical protein